MGRVLLVDDEPAMLFALKELVRSRQHEPVLARSGREALELLADVDAVITDFAMPGFDGLQLLSAVRERDETLPVIFLTAQGSERVAVRAMKGGAYDYVTKPFDIDEMAAILDRALEARSLRVENRRLVAEKALGRSIIGESPAMLRLLDTVARVAPRDLTVLVRGETGTGKELVGSLIHAQSHRARGPLVRFNCAAIPTELAEAELFGHARGAFTGAAQARQGFFARADGGTLILDEVGELPASAQASLLRALQEGEIQPVGAGRVERVDVRVVAATNRDLLARVREGQFREDLYYRLAVVELVVPPLRERREDIPALAREFARRYARRFGMDEVRLSPELLEQLTRRDWPGNVRQLENTVARLVALSTGEEIPAEVLPPDETPAPTPLPAGEAPADPSPGATAEPELGLREQLEALERNLIAKTLAATGGNQAEAARRLGLSRTSLIDRLVKYGLRREG
jgi:DNA-binding NtrC family response regulator